MPSAHSLGVGWKSACRLSSPSSRFQCHGKKQAAAVDGMVFGKESRPLNFQDRLLHDLGKVGQVTGTEDDATFLQGKNDKIQKEKYSRNHY